MVAENSRLAGSTGAGRSRERVEGLKAKAEVEIERRSRPPPSNFLASGSGCAGLRRCRAAAPAGPPAPLPSVPAVSGCEVIACDAGKLQGVELQNVEVVFAVLAQVVAGRDADGHRPCLQQISTQTTFSADKLSAHL